MRETKRLLVSAITTLAVSGWLALPSVAQSGYAPRVYHGARLEPKDKIIHGAGQSDRETFDKYSTLFPEDNKPVLGMWYSNIGGYPGLAGSLPSEFTYLDGKDQYLIVNWGLSIKNDFSDDHARNLARALRDLERPIYLRIGYEFNGSWNGYNPTSYKKRFIQIAEALRTEKADNVATVWCADAGVMNTNSLFDYYPGDEYVDWFGIDMFSASSFDDSRTKWYLEQADKHKKPVIVGESSARGVGTNSNSDWDAWFAKYFAWLKRSPQVKGTGYINWNWPRWNGEWANWGDCRLEQNSYISGKFAQELKDPIWLHSASEEVILKALSGQEPPTVLGYGKGAVRSALFAAKGLEVLRAGHAGLLRNPTARPISASLHNPTGRRLASITLAAGESLDLGDIAPAGERIVIRKTDKAEPAAARERSSAGR